MSIIIDIFDSKGINFNPESEGEEIIQNVKTICKTPKNSVPLDRDFGVDVNAIDKPTPAAMAKIRAEIMQAVERFEPRAKVDGVSFESEDSGSLNIKVKIKLNDDEE